MLKLLEDQHRRLADIVNSLDDQQSEPAQDPPKGSSSQSTNKDGSTTSPPREGDGSGKGKSKSSALASARIGSQARDSSPSLARDIASRRGIPQPGKTQPSAAAQARARQLSPESRRRGTGPPPKVPPSIVDSQASLQAVKKSKKTEEDEGFAKFYSNLTTGTLSKLSSALAYAGLPLTAEDSRPEPSSKHPRRTVSAGDSPDVNKIFSKAALDAIEEEHRQKGTFGHGFGPAESFYMVPASGGTLSYADVMANMAKKDDEAEFVDAKEAPGPPSPAVARFSNQQRGSFGSPRTQEELELENSTLKQTLEQVAARLAAFEAHAQDASMAAVTRSIANLRTEPSGGTGDAAIQERLRQLEMQVEQQAEDRQKLETHALKLEKMNRKWKARWDDVQNRAKERTKAKRESDTKTADEGNGGGDGVIGD